ncbi:MAG: Gx transporter family protein, partial [Limnochordia bacterium]
NRDENRGKIMDIQQYVRLGLLVAVAIVLHVVEAMLPIPTPVPGAKLGLANMVSLFVLLAFGLRNALWLNFLRIIMGSLLSGTLFTITFWLSFSGGMFSILIMGCVYLLAKDRISLIGLSILGALAHNIAQLTVAALIIANWGLFIYLPYLLFFALPTGFFIGILTGQFHQIYQNHLA